jgi:serine/threonine protein kinase
LIQAPDGKRVVGFLEEYIPVSDSWELSTLGSIEAPSEIVESHRKKWALQFEEAVHLLHGMSVIWGDGKASNVLIRRDSDDAWVIDFGVGGQTVSWLKKWPAQLKEMN